MQCVPALYVPKSLRLLTLVLSALGLFALPASGAEYWLQLGDGAGPPAAVRNGDGRLEVFARRTDGAIWHIWQEPTQDTGWSAWQSLGGSFASDPAVALTADGRLEVFVRTAAGTIAQKWRSSAAPQSPWSASWVDVAAGIVGNPVVLQNNASLLEIFARANDGSIGHAAQTSATPGAAWSVWSSLGGFVASDPAVAKNADGRLEVFARTPDGLVWHKWQSAAGGAWSTYWYSLVGSTSGNPAVGRNADGRLELFAVTPQGLLWHRHQATAGATTDWSAEQFLGGDVRGVLAGTGGNLSGSPSIAYDGNGRLGVIARAGNARVWSKWQKTAGVDTWSVWTSTCGNSVVDPAVAPPANGSPELFVRTADGLLWHKRCDDQCLGVQGKSLPVLLYHAFSEAEPTWGIRSLYVKPSELQKQLAYVTGNGYTAVQAQDLETLCVVDKPVMITADDGYDNNATDMYPKLQAANLKATVFSISNAIGSQHYLTEQQMLDMLPLVSFQNHTANHLDLTTLTAAQVRSEITTATSRLQTLTGQTVLAVAYPYGTYNATVESIARESLPYGFATVTAVYRLGEDRYAIPRIYIDRDDSLTTFIQKLYACTHSEYGTGGPLTSGCGGSCTTTVCASQPYCCQTTWDQLCVNAARTQCDVAVP